MILFETERLIVKSLEKADKELFVEMFTDPKILAGIPQKPFTEIEASERFDRNLSLTVSNLKSQKCTCGIFEKRTTEMVGLALFLKNEHDESELGYRFREKFWNKGYGTETTKGMLAYYFNILKTEKVTADVNITNSASVKILNKLMKPIYEFFNERDQCTDRRYVLLKKSWLQDPLQF